MTPDARSSTSIAIRPATAADAGALAALASEAFDDTFGPDNTPGEMAMYLAEAFGGSAQGAEIADPCNTVLLAERGGEMVGYAMLREGEVPPEIGDPQAIEIARLYSFTRWIGSGVGAALMRRCLDEAASRGRRTIWLGVWERNARAIAFYHRWGFADVGSHPFQLGNDLQTDRLMSRHVSEAR